MSAGPVIDVAATGKRIQSQREAAGISIRELQNALGFTSQQAIYKWQWGECLPSIDNLVIIASLLGCKVDDLLVLRED